MPDIAFAVAGGRLGFLPEDALADYVTAQRWFASKSREVAEIGVSAALPLRARPPLLVAALVEVRFQPGTHEIYQLLLGLRPAAHGWSEAVICEVEGWTVYEATADPEAGRCLLGLMRAGRDMGVADARGEFRAVGAADGARPVSEIEVRPMGAEQSNSSIVYGSDSVLKLYRRLEAGVNPELELLHFLTAHGFEHVARLQGFYAFAGRLMDATLGVLQEFLPDARDGWGLALDELGQVDGPARFLERLGALGEITGRMHTVLGSEAADPAFAPEEPSPERLAILTATIDEEIERLFLALPLDREALAPIAGRGDEVRERLRLLSQIGAAGRLIRHHGDLHLGQTLFTERGWVILDFEGEPARSLAERRQKRSPLRDVAGMLRSFAYATSATRLQRDTPAPADWEQRARERFLEAYLAAADPALLPPGRQGTERLLAIFELEKAVYELRYELDNRPDWVAIPVAGIARLLETEL